MTHVIVGDDLISNMYQDYLESAGDTVVKSLTNEGPFDLGFICGKGNISTAEYGRINVNSCIELLAPRCKVLVTPKLEVFDNWTSTMKMFPSCQFVMAKPDLYRPQIKMLRDIQLMKDIIHNIEIWWTDEIGLIHMAHAVAGPLSMPTVEDAMPGVMIFKNYGIEIFCEVTDKNSVRINFKDGSVTTHAFTLNPNSACSMIQDLFKLTKFNPGEFHKHFILDAFVHTLLE